MSKRKPSSPYKRPATPGVRALIKRGWRRCDAEGIFVVMCCVLAAEHVDRENLRTLAAAATKALAREPVLGGAMLLAAPWPGAAHALWLLLRNAPVGSKGPMYRLWRAAVAAEVDAEEDQEDDDEDVDDEELDDEELDDELPA
jgi:predicted small lipoprotein YifL